MLFCFCLHVLVSGLFFLNPNICFALLWLGGGLVFMQFDYRDLSMAAFAPLFPYPPTTNRHTLWCQMLHFSWKWWMEKQNIEHCWCRLFSFLVCLLKSATEMYIFFVTLSFSFCPLGFTLHHFTNAPKYYNIECTLIGQEFGRVCFCGYFLIVLIEGCFSSAGQMRWIYIREDRIL